MMKEIKVNILQNPCYAGTSVYVVEVRDGTIYLAKPVKFKFEKIKDFERQTPTFVFNWQDGQQFLHGLSDALIEAGFRDKAISKDGEIKRMEAHLSYAAVSSASMEDRMKRLIDVIEIFAKKQCPERREKDGEQ